MDSNVIVGTHIDNLLTTSTLAGAQSTLNIRPDVTTVVQANSSTWGSINQAALNLKANKSNPTFSGVLSSTGPAVFNVNSLSNAVRITQSGTGSALIVEDSSNPDTTAFIITSSGDVGIGKFPSTTFEVEGNNNVARFSGTFNQNNGITIKNSLANAETYKTGFVDFQNENNITISNISAALNANGSSDLKFATTLSGDRTVDRKTVRVVITPAGNVGIGVASPGATLHVNGNIIGSGLTTSGVIAANGGVTLGNVSTLFIPSSSKVQFGSPGENTDDMFIQRVNSGTYFGGRSELRINIGDDPWASGVFAPLSGTYVDSIVIGTANSTWLPKIVLDSHGLISCFGDYNIATTNPLTGSPAMPVSGAHLTTKRYVDEKGTPTGAIMTFAMSAAPAGWLYCNGQQVSRTTYAGLFSVIGTSYGIGNGTTTFNVPDLRGEFIRGWDDGRNIDKNRTFRSTQKGTITIVDPNLNSNNVAGIYSAYEYNSDQFAAEAGYDIINTADYSGVYRSSVGGVGFGALNTNGFGQGATRPRNIALYYCIKV